MAPPIRQHQADATATESVDQGASGARPKRAAGEGGLVGSALGDRFEILRHLGEGGSGNVYEAFDHESQRTVAVKLLSRLSPAAIERLKQEARELSTFSHPNLVTFFDLVGHEENWLFSMESIEGAEFSVALQAASGDCDHDRLVRALGQLVRGVSALHARGRVHRDLKSSNVLVQPDGRVVVIDLGLVRAVETAEALRGFAGTPAYAAPEQMQGREAGPSCDWYAVGVMLYETLTGTLPFHGRPHELVAAKLAKHYTPPSAIAAHVPPELEALCSALLEPDPARRLDGEGILRVIAPHEPRAESESPPEPPPRLIGRDAALERLHEAFARTQAAQVATVLVHGASGIGKTALVNKFVEDVRAPATRNGVLVLSSRCYPHEQLPFQALDSIVDGIARYLRQLPAARAAGMLSPEVHLLARMFPVLRTVEALRELPHPISSAKLENDELRTRGARSMAALLEAIACELPLVLFIDDLHAGTVDGLLLLNLVLESSQRGRVLWLMTAHRPVALSGHAVEHSKVELGPLSSEATSELVRELLGEAGSHQLAEGIAQESHGHPLHVRELAGQARSTGRASLVSLADALATRLSGRREVERAIMHALALAGQPLERGVLLRAVGTAQLSDLRVLAKEQLIRTVARADGTLSYEPHHDQIRHAALAQLDAQARRTLHEQLAEAYTGFGPADLTPAVTHYLEAGRPRDAAVLAAQAAYSALDALAFHRAADMFAVATRHTSEPERLHALEDHASEVFLGVGRNLEAAELFARRAARAPREQAFELERRAMMSEFFGGEYLRGRARLGRLAAQVGLPFPRSRLLMLVHAWLLGLRYVLFGVPVLVEGRSPSVRERQRAVLAWSCMAIQNSDPTTALYYGVISLGETARSGQAAEYAVAAIGWCASVKGTFGFVPSRTASIVELAQRVSPGSPLRSWIHAMLGLLHVMQGDIRQATAALHEAAETPEAPGQASARHFARSGLLVSLFWAGGARELSAQASTWVRDAEQVRDAQFGPFIRFVAAFEHLVRDDLARARAQLGAVKALPEWDTHPGRNDVWWETWTELYAGNPERAYQLARLLPQWRRFDLPVVNHAIALFVRGQAAAGVLGTQPERVHELSKTRKQLARVRHTWAPGLAELLRATEQAALGHPTRASESLERAEQELSRVGLEGFAAAACARRAALLGGSAGRELSLQASARLRELGFANEAAWLRLMTPGF